MNLLLLPNNHHLMTVTKRSLAPWQRLNRPVQTEGPVASASPVPVCLSRPALKLPAAPPHFEGIVEFNLPGWNLHLENLAEARGTNNRALSVSAARSGACRPTYNGTQHTTLVTDLILPMTLCRCLAAPDKRISTMNMAIAMRRTSSNIDVEFRVALLDVWL